MWEASDFWLAQNRAPSDRRWKLPLKIGDMSCCWRANIWALPEEQRCELLLQNGCYDLPLKSKYMTSSWRAELRAASEERLLWPVNEEQIYELFLKSRDARAEMRDAPEEQLYFMTCYCRANIWALPEEQRCELLLKNGYYDLQLRRKYMSSSWRGEMRAAFWRTASMTCHWRANIWALPEEQRCELLLKFGYCDLL